MSHALFPEARGNSVGPVPAASGGLGAAISQKASIVALAVALSSGALVGLAAPAEAGVSVKAARSGVVSLTNDKRAAKGCKPLKVSKSLTKAAQRHANDMSRKYYFSHTSADGTSWDERIERAGWDQPGGENIAVGFDSVTGVLRGWMNSPGHKRNVLDCNFRYIGIGYTANGKYWVQDFGY